MGKNNFNTTGILVALCVIVGAVSIIYALINVSPEVIEIPAVSGNRIEEIVAGDREAINLEIESFAFNQTVSGVENVSVRIKNISPDTQDARVWYIISDIGADVPWNAARYTSPSVEIDDLAPDATFDAEFPDSPDNLAPLEYNISFWVHTREGETSAHADGIMYWHPIWQGNTIQFSIEDASINSVSEDTFYEAEVILSALNKTPDTISLALSYTISTPDTEEPWLNGEYSAPFEYFELEAGETHTATYSNLLSLEAGTYIVTAFLHQIEEDTQVEVAKQTFDERFELP